MQACQPTSNSRVLNQHPWTARASGEGPVGSPEQKAARCGAGVGRNCVELKVGVQMWGAGIGAGMDMQVWSCRAMGTVSWAGSLWTNLGLVPCPHLVALHPHTNPLEVSFVPPLHVTPWASPGLSLRRPGGGGCSGRGCVPQACPCCWSLGWALPLQGSPATSLHALAPPLPTSVPQGCSAEWRAGPGTTLPASPGLLGSLAELTVWESAGPWYPPTALQDQGPGSRAPWFPAAEGSSDRKLLLWPSPVPEWPASRRSETPAMPQCPSQTGPAVVSLPCLTLPPPLRILPASLPCLVLSHLPAGPQPFSPAATAQLVWAGSSPGTELI